MAPSGSPVLVGIDFSSDCAAALRWAWGQAQERGAPLVAVTVWEYPRRPPAVGGVPLGGFPSPAERREQVEEALAAVVRAAGLPDPVRRETGSPAVLLRAARRHEITPLARGAAMLVLPGEVRDQDTDFLTGEVRRELASACGCPVVLVSAGSPAGTGEVPAGEPVVVDLRNDHRAELAGC
ncbi:nucleotide-binding universal stress UspA family protein [Kineococcus xinjiangensis]|uniref:Nucleotide-binding universal stress UspA family protein n=1 Tax=Kineococcus xinjiangensis TaxID=512762 RepID=A0A2S6IK62_9ACTN|nr:universal stress protein [Kineococcus xinjiangensis]PPK94617.1 nucleotide-binding universal stress UspA family protein [Kineococcus xinjiangensis]